MQLVEKTRNRSASFHQYFLNLSLGSTRGRRDGAPAPRALGHVGPDADLGGPLRRGQHLLQLEARLHLQREPVPRAAAGLALQDGHGHPQVHLALLPRPFCFLLR